ncbi:MAG: AAA family ATPase [Lachnospiraceae bacterium]|nr:AAA family ATPase [Lachnospiraceae bacterium]
MEKSKWQKELAVFSRIVNTIVLTGNINDQYPVVDEKEDRIRGFCSLEMYIAKTCESLGYNGVIFYNPVEGFHDKAGFDQKTDIIDLIEKTVDREKRERENREEGTLNLIRRRNAQGQISLSPESIEDAANIISLIMMNSTTPVAMVLSFSSRMSARPDDLDINERMTFMHLEEGAVNAKKNRIEDPKGGSPVVLSNQLFLIADKINDLPAWYYLSHPSFKNIEIPRPDYRMRSFIIDGYAASYPGYTEASEDERTHFKDTFVGAAEGFTTQDIARVFQLSRISGLDVNNVDKAILLYKHGVTENPWMKLDSDRLQKSEEKIKKRVLGQDEVVKDAIDIVKRAAMGMSGLQHSSSSSKPRGILFLAGPTGTGKTELAKALTELIFLDERNMIRFDMSEYRQEQSDQRLLGAPPGYVGYEAGGQLTNAVREHPFSVLLFDEIEKAHPSVLDKFLQILEDGRITDGKGDTVYFQDCLIIFTSNLGITRRSELNPNVRIPNVSFEEDTDYQVVRDKILNGVRNYFNEELGRPELLNRIGNNILVFNYIREDSIRPIIEKQVNNIKRYLLAERHINLELSKEAEDELFEMALADLPKGQGGRGIGNMIEEMLINPLARYMFDEGKIHDKNIPVEHIYRENGTSMIKVRKA